MLVSEEIGNKFIKVEGETFILYEYDSDAFVPESQIIKVTKK